MSDGRLIAGVELGGTKCICVLGTADGKVIAEERMPTEAPAVVLPGIEAVFDRWKAERDFGAIGIASFGPLDLDPASPTWGYVTKTVKPGWNDVDIARRLGNRYGLKAAIDTDVVGAALSEGRWGGAKGLDDYAYVTVGTGIGVGLIVGGKPILGFTHAEIGHVRVPRIAGDDFAGICSAHGDCAEGLASGPAIIARMGRSASHVDPSDPVWDLVADAIAHMLGTMVLTASPRRILMGGGVMNGQPHLFPKIRARLQASLAGFVQFPQILSEIDDYVVPAALGDHAGVLGALAVSLNAGPAGHSAAHA